MIIAIGIIFSLWCLFNPKTEYFLGRWFLATEFVLIMLCYQVYIIAGVPFALLLLYISSSANYYAMYPFQNHFTNNPAFKNIGLMREALKNLAAIILFIITFIWLDHTFINYFLKAAPFIVLFASFLMLLPPKIKVYNVNGGNKTIATYGFCANPGTAAQLIALLSMVCLLDVQIYTLPILAIALVAIIKSKTSTGLGGMMAGLGVYFLYSYPIVTIISSIIIIGLLILINKYHYYGRLFQATGRKIIWESSFKFLYGKNGKYSKLTGIGCGTYAFSFPLMQLMNKQTELALWMHCDIAQFFLEGGIIGFLILLTTIICILPVIIMTPSLAAFASCFFVMSLVNFPIHMGETVFLLAMVSKIIYT